MRLLTAEQARKFYDRFGPKQDSQSFYEDAALTALIAHADFEPARNVFELGCGTGRFAERLLINLLPPDAHYFGVDVSPVMIELAANRLAPMGGRVRVAVSDGSMHIDAPDHTIDRVVCTYVLDLLHPDDIRSFLIEAHRVLTPKGKLCVVGLNAGSTVASRFVSSAWSAVHRLKPEWVGGCRPLNVGEFLDSGRWAVDHNETVVAFGIPSEVMVARPSGG